MRNYANVILIGLLIIMISTCVIVGWFFYIPQMVQIFPGYIGMVFNTAFCFLIVGFSFLVSAYHKDKIKNLVYLYTGAILIIFPSIVLSQNIFGIDLNIDQLFTEAWLNDPNPHPGRMAPNTCLAFIMVGLTFILLPFSYRKAAIVLMQLNVLIIMMMGIIAITSYSLKLELIYEAFNFTRMSLHTAVTMIIVSIGFWLLLWKNTWFHQFYELNEDKKILMVSSVILLCVSFTAGVAGYTILAHESEKNIQMLFQYALNEKVHAFESSINQAIRSSDMVYQNDAIMNKIDNYLKDPQKNRLTLNWNNFKQLGVSSLQITDSNNKTIFNMGEATDKALKLKVKVSKSSNMYLIWQNGFELQSVKNLNQNGKSLAILKLNYTLTQLTKKFLYDSWMDSSTEFQICTQESLNQAICFPNRFKKESYNLKLTREQFYSPMYYALKGEYGVQVLHDYRNKQVVAAYSPIGTFKLGLVLKTDSTELFAPIRKNLNIVLPLVGLIIILGSILLYYQVQPLVARMINSEKNLRASEERLKLAVGSTSDGLWDWDINTDTVYYSPRFKEIIGYAENELTNSREEFISRLHPEDRENTLATLNAHIKDKTPYNVEYRLKRKDGTYAWINARGHASWDKEGKPVHVSGFITDITQRKEVEKLKNEFVSTVSHELRTPLTSIRGSLELISTGVAGVIPEKAVRLINIAQKNCERLILLINDILDIQKIESGQMRFVLQWVNIREVIASAIELNKGYGEKFNVSFKAKEPIIDTQVYVDRDRLMQVLSNLMSNAVKFSPQQGTVEIQTQDLGNRVRICIIDHGPGIPKEFYSRIFNKFAQADGSTVKQQGGTGLGLNISKTIIERFGGTIDFTSELDKGTIFYFDLPKPDQPEIEPPTQDIIHKNKILICEDDKDIAHLIKGILNTNGFVVDIAFTAQQAKKLIATNHYAGLTLDLVLPDADGLKLIHEIRENPKTRSLPIVVISIMAEEGKHAFKGNAVGVIDWLPKPINQERLVEAIHKMPMDQKKNVLIYTSEEDENIVSLDNLANEFSIIHANDLETAETYLSKHEISLILWYISGSREQQFQFLDIVGSIPVIILSETNVSQEISNKVASAMIKSEFTAPEVSSQINSILLKTQSKGVQL